MSKLTEYQLTTNQKRIFDPSKKEDVSLLKYFLKLSKWGKPCPFLLEEPYLTIPDMVKDKYIKFSLGI